MGTKIEWVRGPDGKPGETWSPMSGCSKCSLGCLNCWAERMSKRLYQGEKWKPWTEKNVNTNIRIHPERFRNPFRLYEPRTILTCPMGDLFHGHLPYGFVPDIFGIMGAAHWHSFFVLTKRPEMMRDRLIAEEHVINQEVLFWSRVLYEGSFRARKKTRLGLPPWPLQNVIPGTSVEDQDSADERIPYLLQTPAAKRLVSIEPMLGPIELDAPGRPWLTTEIDHEEDTKLDLIIAGGESGPKARPFDLDWALDLIDQCRRTGTKIFIKQLGTHWARKVGAKSYKGSDPEEWPEDLRVREMPEVGR